MIDCVTAIGFEALKNAQAHQQSRNARARARAHAHTNTHTNKRTRKHMHTRLHCHFDSAKFALLHFRIREFSIMYPYSKITENDQSYIKQPVMEVQ